MKEKQPFYTEKFYEDPKITLDILNKLIDDDHVADMDMYKSGTFLFMEVYDNEKTRDILSPIISDIDAYIKYNNEGWVSDESTEIGLCGLQDDHRSQFYNDGQEILWDDRFREFVFLDDLI